MNKNCPKCNSMMESETRPIPKSVTLPTVFSPTISIEEYLPSILKKYSNYTIFVCAKCGYAEVFIT